MRVGFLMLNSYCLQFLHSVLKVVINRFLFLYSPFFLLFQQVVELDLLCFVEIAYDFAYPDALYKGANIELNHHNAFLFLSL